MLTHTHRNFVQYMLKKGSIPKRKVFPILAKLRSEITDEAGFELLLSRINKKIYRYHFKIACVTCEVTGEELLVWLNMKNDNMSKLQGIYTPAELEYFQIMMGEIILSDEKCLPLNVCLNLSTTLQANVLFKTEAQKAINKWVKGGYLVIRNGKVYMGARCIHEFSSYFRRQEDRVTICSLCSEIVFVGNICGICNNVFHKICISKYLKRKKNCPNCKNPWEEGDSES